MSEHTAHKCTRGRAILVSVQHTFDESTTEVSAGAFFDGLHEGPSSVLVGSVHLHQWEVESYT